MGDIGGLDVVFITVVILAAIRASFRGMVRELMSVAAVFLGIAAAVYLSGMVTNALADQLGTGPLAQVAAFLGVFLAVYVLVRLTQKLLDSIVERVHLENVDHALGFFVGLAEGLVAITAIIVALQIQPLFDPNPMLGGSVIARWLVPLLPRAANLVQNSLE